MKYWQTWGPATLAVPAIIFCNPAILLFLPKQGTTIGWDLISSCLQIFTSNFLPILLCEPLFPLHYPFSPPGITACRKQKPAKILGQGVSISRPITNFPWGRWSLSTCRLEMGEVESIRRTNSVHFHFIFMSLARPIFVAEKNEHLFSNLPDMQFSHF